MHAFHRTRNRPLRTQALSASTLVTTRLMALVCGVGVLTLCSRLYLPLWGTPVPFTWQPQAVLLVAALTPFGMGTSAVMSWLALGALGAPVFASSALLGLPAWLGPTGGYLAAYLPIAWGMSTWGRDLRPINLAVWLLGSLGILMSGTLWLAWWVGAKQAVRMGATPFLAGDMLKTCLIFVVQRQVRLRARGTASL